MLVVVDAYVVAVLFCCYWLIVVVVVAVVVFVKVVVVVLVLFLECVFGCLICGIYLFTFFRIVDVGFSVCGVGFFLTFAVALYFLWKLLFLL